jgi:CheY-like chemotaxis protein
MDPRRRVSIVDDTEAVVGTAHSAVATSRCQVATTASAAQALPQTRSFKAGLVWLDIQTPAMGGIAFTCPRKADRPARHIVVVAFTACAIKITCLGGCATRQLVQTRVHDTDSAPGAPASAHAGGQGAQA